MTLKVVGAGLGRTGTNSLKAALERLGLGPCHHMIEVLDNAGQIAHWRAAAEGDLPDWDVVFEGFNSAVDRPSAFFWRQLAAHFASAKVLLSVRPEQAWHASIESTIFPVLRNHRDLPPGNKRDAMAMAHRLIAERNFGGRIDDPEHVLSVYRANTEAVRRAIASERLLVYDVAEGWGPLCRFLDVAVPPVPFPHNNTTKDFQAHFAAARAG